MSAPTHRVAVIIPAYNAAGSLAACLASVFAQRRPADAVIVVDDGSTDGTAALARGRAGVTVLEQPNRGAGAARNAGVAAAQADYLAFLDADDAWEPDFLAETVAFLDAHPDAMAVSTAGRTFDASGRSVWTVPRGLDAMPAESGILPDFFAFWARHDHVRTGTVLIRRDAALAAGGQREDLRMSQDLEYWAQLGTLGPWGFIPRPLWRGTSRQAARALGRRAKYAQRRRLCPTIAQWESRVRPRLHQRDLVAFKHVRARVAADLLHARILAGDDAGAWAMWEQDRTRMRRTRVTRLMRAAARAGRLGWWAACRLLRAYEAFRDRR